MRARRCGLFGRCQVYAKALSDEVVDKAGLLLGVIAGTVYNIG